MCCERQVIRLEETVLSRDCRLHPPPERSFGRARDQREPVERLAVLVLSRRSGAVVSWGSIKHTFQRSCKRHSCRHHYCNRCMLLRTTRAVLRTCVQNDIGSVLPPLIMSLTQNDFSVTRLATDETTGAVPTTITLSRTKLKNRRQKIVYTSKSCQTELERRGEGGGVCSVQLRYSNIPFAPTLVRRRTEYKRRLFCSRCRILSTKLTRTYEPRSAGASSSSFASCSSHNGLQLRRSWRVMAVGKSASLHS